MKRDHRNFAYFVKTPCRISDCCRPHLVEDEIPYAIYHSMALGDDGYESFCQDLATAQAFMETAGLPYREQTEGFLCVLIYRKTCPGTGGILAAPDENGHIGYVAFTDQVEKQWRVNGG